MEHKIDEIITVTINNETIQLKVIPVRDCSCRDCFFYLNYKSCHNIRDIIGQCDNKLRTDKTHVIFRKIMKNENIVKSDNQSSDIYKKDVLGKWINLNDIDPIEIKDLKPGDYIILRVQYDSVKFDYKLAYVDCIRNGKLTFNIQSINVLRTPIKITDFCILPSYSSNNFYKTNK